MYGMTPVGVFFTAIFPLVINGQALCQQLQVGPKFTGPFPLSFPAWQARAAACPSNPPAGK